MISVGTNTIFLSFWVHSKYQFVNSTDDSSSISKNSSGLVFVFYSILILLGGFKNINTNIEYIPKFVLYKDTYLIDIDPVLNKLDMAQRLLSSICFLFMINFYFMVLKEVILRKSTSRQFKGIK